MKITRIEARSGVALGRALKLSALGVLTMSVSALIACGGFDNPTTSAPHIGSGGSAGTSSTSNGGSTTTTGGTSSPSAGTGPVASGGGGTGGDTSIAGTTSVGGTPPATAPFCSPTATPVQTRAPLPLAVTTVFTPSGYEGGDPGQNGNGQIGAVDCGADRAPGTSIGKCSKYTYTPATPATWAGVAYILGYMGFGSTGHAPLCLADGATAITFYAKGAVGGEVVGFAGGTAASMDVTLTADWKLYTIPLSGVQYNGDAMGLTDGFFWKVAPAAGTTAVVETFSVDDIQYVGGAPGGGGSGGAGGTSAGGTGGAGGAAAGAGGTAAGSGGTGGA